MGRVESMRGSRWQEERHIRAMIGRALPATVRGFVFILKLTGSQWREVTWPYMCFKTPL